MATKNTTMYLRRVPKTLKDMFKGICHRRGDNMEDVIPALIRAYIENPERFRIDKQTREPARVLERAG